MDQYGTLQGVDTYCTSNLYIQFHLGSEYASCVPIISLVYIISSVNPLMRAKSFLVVCQYSSLDVIREQSTTRDIILTPVVILLSFIHYTWWVDPRGTRFYILSSRSF